MRVFWVIFFCGYLLTANTAMPQDGKRVSKGIQVSGVVVYFSGRPAEGALVKLASTDIVRSDDDKAIQKETKTDKDGRYSFTGLPEGVYEVSLERESRALKEIKEVPIVPEGSIFEVDFGLEIGSIGECPLHFVLGKVTDKKNKAIEGAKVSVINAFNQRRVLSAKTEKDGTFKIDLCNPGQYIVFVNTPNYEVQTERVSFLPKELSKNVNFVIEPLP